MNPAKLWSGRSSQLYYWCPENQAEGASSHVTKPASVFHWTITVIHLICINPDLFPVFQGRTISLFFQFCYLHLKVSLSLSFEETADQTSSSACSLEPDGGFPAFTAAGRSHKDTMTLLIRGAGVSALWVLSVKAVTQLSAAEFTNMHKCALCCSRTHRGIT